MQPSTPGLKKIHGWFCKVRETETSECDMLFWAQLQLNLTFILIRWERSWECELKVPRVTSHGGQRSSDHIHGFGVSWWVMTGGVKTHTVVSGQAWNDLLACFLSQAVQQKENKDVFLKGTSSWKNSCMCGDLLFPSSQIILSEQASYC